MRRCTALGFIFALVYCPFVVSAADAPARPTAYWPMWRGPDQNGYASDTRAPLEWSATKNLRWQIDLPGFGNSSPIVWGERVFLTSATKDGTERHVLCVDRRDGKILWKDTAYKGPREGKIHEWNTHASASCVTDGERVYAFFGTPGVYCYDFAGKQLWKRDFGKMDTSTEWGVGAASPALCDELLIVNGDHGAEGAQRGSARGGKGPEKDYGPSYLWALNKTTGAIVWKTERNQGMGWSTPIVLDSPAGKKEIIVNSPHGVWAYDPKDGKELWRFTGRSNQELFGEIAPVWGNGLLYAFTGRPGPIHAIKLGGSGDISKTHLAWSTRQAGRDVSSPILVGDYLFEAVGRSPIMTCIDAKTGKKLGSQRLGGSPCASFVYVRGKILLVSDDGTTFVIEPGPEMKILAKNKLGDGDEFRASPAVVDGQILIRSDRRLYCVGE
jgi:outer membrane protein assembly factor BamB